MQHSFANVFDEYLNICVCVCARVFSESFMAEGADRRAMDKCVFGTVKEKFTFVSLREMVRLRV